LFGVVYLLTLVRAQYAAARC